MSAEEGKSPSGRQESKDVGGKVASELGLGG